LSTRNVDLERSQRLRSVDLTSGLDRVALARLAAYMEPIAVRSGETIIREGEIGDALYIIVNGTFAVLAGPAEERLNTIGPGHYVGELALLIDEPRTATIRAETDGEVLRLARPQFVDLLGRDAAAAKAVATTLARRLRHRDGAPVDEAAAVIAPVRPPRTERHPATKLIGVLVALALVAAAFSPLVDLAQVKFSLLLGAAIALWVTEPVPNVVVSLGLVASWILSGIVPPFATLTGFASMSWVFVLSVLGVAAAVTRSGLLLRLGLLFIDRVPARLGWQSAAFLGTGILLSPLLPSAMARAAITAPLAEGVADAMKLPERSAASATIGLSAWIGAGPFLFLFLNGSSVCLLAWGLMPSKDQLQFTWLQWFISAAPLATFIAIGTFVAMRVLFRAGPVAAPARAPLRLQRAVLGPPSRRELAIAAIVVAMLAGWIIGPKFLWEPGRVALVAFIAMMVVTGISDLRNLDWDYLIFFGVALTAGNLVEGLRLDKIVGDGAAVFLAQLGIGGAAFVILAGALTILVKSLLAADQAILLLSLALIPVAGGVHISPWLAVVAILALGISWHMPAQSPEYLVAYGATHGRLYSHLQARKMAFAYEAIALAGLALSLPYWHVLGYL
jgi:CRP-like cAMP-binding protein/di/tricarboxylate transporter